MAPDATAASAGRKLAKAAAWRSLGRGERAFWGECQGSALYQTQVSALDLATKCGCPSRKFPCKHALGLLFLIAESPGAFVDSTEPEWVTSWHSKRSAAQQKKQERADQAATKPVDTDAQAKRANRRHTNVLSGIEQLEVWMCDLLRRGFGRLPSEGAELFDAQARRLVDAQAPGLASRLRSTAYRVGVGDDWAERVLGDLGQLALLTRAYRRIDALPPGLQEEVRRLVGFTLDQSEVLARGEIVEDEWVVASCRVVDDDRLRIQRVWLVGVESGRHALVLQIAAGMVPFQEMFVIGSALHAKVAYWPGARSERALFAERTGGVEMGRSPTHARSIGAALDDYATGIAQNPWLGRTLVLLESVAITRAPGGSWYAVEGGGTALPLSGERHEMLTAVSGGHPVLLAAEWNGFALDPLAVYAEGRGVALYPEVT